MSSRRRSRSPPRGSRQSSRDWRGRRDGPQIHSSRRPPAPSPPPARASSQPAWLQELIKQKLKEGEFPELLKEKQEKKASEPTEDGEIDDARDDRRRRRGSREDSPPRRKDSLKKSSSSRNVRMSDQPRRRRSPSPSSSSPSSPNARTASKSKSISPRKGDKRRREAEADAEGRVSVPEDSKEREAPSDSDVVVLSSREGSPKEAAEAPATNGHAANGAAKEQGEEKEKPADEKPAARPIEVDSPPSVGRRASPDTSPRLSASHSKSAASRFESPIGDSPPPKRQKQEDRFDSDSDSDLEMEAKKEGAEEKEETDEAKRERLAGLLRHLPHLSGCRSVQAFKRLNTIAGGTYGVVHRAQDKQTGEIVALKKIKIEKNLGGFPITSLREINILLNISHPNIVGMKEIVIGEKISSVYMVMEYIDHDLKELMKHMPAPFGQSEVKCLLLQLLRAVEAFHENWILHRDLKTSNLLLSNKGILKVCDFGLARKYGDPIGKYTDLVVTLWYRAPELLLGTKEYSTAIDMWSVGCIFAEILTKKPLFPGKGELDQLGLIFRTLGTPNEEIWPGFNELPQTSAWKFKKHPNILRTKFPALPHLASGPYLTDTGLDLMQKMLTYDPKKRITATEALQHPYFKESPRPQDPSMMPTFRPTNERRQRDSPVADVRAQREDDYRGFFLA